MKDVFNAVRIPEEAGLLDFFERSFNLSAINSLLKMKLAESPDHSLPFYMRGYHLPIYAEFGGALYDTCNKAIKRLGFPENKFEFYVDNSPNFNTISICSAAENEPFTIVFNRGLVERVGQEELSFVIGHEVGHLVYDHTSVQRVFEFVYPEYDNLPPLLKKLHSVWSQLGEISADRIGLLACGDYESAIRALFKLSSGLDEKHFNLSHENLKQIVERTFAEMKQNPSYVSGSHPANPIRIKSLMAFHDSALYKSVKENKAIQKDKKLEAQIDELVSVLKKMPFNEKEEQELKFLASAGLMLMLADKEVDDREHSYLLNVLSQYVHWPPAYLDILKKDDVLKAFKCSAEFITTKCPWESRDLLKQLFNIIIRDNLIRNEELDLFMGIGVKDLKISPSEVIDIILEGTRKRYCPLS
jgi:Zn-dependent protease with chaperone function